MHATQVTKTNVNQRDIVDSVLKSCNQTVPSGIDQPGDATPNAIGKDLMDFIKDNKHDSNNQINGHHSDHDKVHKKHGWNLVRSNSNGSTT